MRRINGLNRCGLVLAVGLLATLVPAVNGQEPTRTQVSTPNTYELELQWSNREWAARPPSPTRAALEHMISPDYNGVALNQILEMLSDDLNIPFHVEVNELDSLGVAVDTPITLRLPEVPLRQALRYILKPLDLSYRIDGEVLLVSAAERVNARPTFCVYDLTLLSADSANAEQLGSVVDEAIKTIEPVEWFDGVWRTQRQGDRLIVCCSEMAHGEIKLLLARLAQQLNPDASSKLNPVRALQSPQLDKPQPSKQVTPANPNPFGDPTSDDPFGGSARDDPFGN